MNIDEISKSVREALITVNSRLSGKGYGCGVWTKAIKTALCEIGNKFGYRVAARDVDNAKDPEWLFDVVWMTLAWEPSRQLERIHLVVESEWGNRSKIFDDFEKILVARSDVRLFIFEQSDKLKVEGVFNLLHREAQGFGQSQVGDYYLLAGYDCAESNFLWREFSV